MADEYGETATDDELTGAEDPGDDSGGSAIALGLLLLVVIAIVAAVVLATYDSGDAEPTTEDEVVVVPDEPADIEDGAGMDDEPEVEEVIGADHPLVGSTESEVRERYPFVRVVEVDGEFRPATMDLLYGRVNLRLADGIVIGADVEGCDEAVSEELAWAMQACEPEESDGPTVTGTAARDGDALVLGEADDEYYLDMSLEGDDEQVPHITDLDGEVLGIDDIEDGDKVLVWTVGGCRESSPVQCSVGAIVVDRRD